MLEQKCCNDTEKTLSGAVIIFTGLLARVALKQKFEKHNVLGMFIIVIGLIYVGCSQTLNFREFYFNCILFIVITFKLQGPFS